MKMMKKTVFLLGVFLLASVLASAAGAAIIPEPTSTQISFSLPAPQKSGGQGVFDALATRASATQGNFPTGKISPKELSTILWAASGLNRPDRGWTVPMAMGREPYCKIYALGHDGAFRYDWKKHELVTVAREDIRPDISGQAFVAKAPYVLVFVADGKGLSSFKEPSVALSWANVAAGAMTQNVYLASGALGIGARYMASFNEAVARDALQLDKNDMGICIMPLGKR